MEHDKQFFDLFDPVENAKKEWEDTMDCIRDLVLLIDSSGKIRRCNQVVSELIGKTYDDIIGLKWEDVLLTSEMETSKFSLDRGELFHKLSGRWFYVNSYPFKGFDGDTSPGTVITLNDSTEMKRVVAHLEQAYTELKTTQTQMLQTERMASIGQLAAGVAHEINNPVGFVSSNLNTLEKYVERMTGFINAQGEIISSLVEDKIQKKFLAMRKELKLDYILGDARELIAESLDGIERVQRIVQDLKFFSRMDASAQKKVDLNECLERTINIVWNELKYKVALRKDLKEIPLTKCYPHQLNQVFLNLLVNASQAIDKQGDILVRSWHENDSILVSFSDTGCGMPESMLERIFEPFFTTKDVGNGTGLGLSISYDIVKKHGGDIVVQSEPGKGSTFAIKIPVVDDD